MSGTWIVALGAILLGGFCGSVGVLAVLRRRALVGDAVAHAALPGIVLAFLATGSRTLPVLLAGALAAGLLGVAAMAWIARRTRTKPDAALAVVLSGGFGLGIALSRHVQNSVVDGSQAGLDSFLLGRTAGIVLSDVLTIAGVASVGALVLIGLHREFKLLGFDPEFAASLGRMVGRLDFVILGLLVAAVVVALPMVGVVMVAALTILPPLAARFWTDAYGAVVILGGTLGAASAGVGVALSTQAERLPAGPLIILVAGGIFLVSALAAPRRGLLARAHRLHRLRMEVARK